MLAPPTGPVDMVIDTDTYNEIDDQFAIAYALLSPQNCHVEAIYAAPFHNRRSTVPADGMEQSFQEILRLLDLLDPSSRPRALKGSTTYLRAPAEPVPSAAAEDLVNRAMARREGPLYVAAIAAGTNIASALLLEPRIIERIVLIWLAGQPHDWPTSEEFNLSQDVPAAQVIFDCGVPLVHVPCKNVAEHLCTSLAELKKDVAGHGSIGDFLVERFEQYRKDHFAFAKPLWDVATVAWLIRPDWVATKLVPSPRPGDDNLWQHDSNRHTIRVATGMDRNGIFGDMFTRLRQAQSVC